LYRTDASTLSKLRSHVEFLADDGLEGRRTGTPGEVKAMEYIRDRFRETGLSPMGKDGYIQSFDVQEGRMMDPSAQLQINGDALVPGTDFFIFPFSAAGKGTAQVTLSVQEAEIPWVLDLKDAQEENRGNPHFDFLEYIRTNSRKAKERGATALFLYNSSAGEDRMTFDAKDRSASVGIPVFYIKKDAALRVFKDPAATVALAYQAAVTDKKRTGHNVVGYIDNGAAHTIILGAHYDHLGYGEDGNSRMTEKQPAIHNGADDNASGTAALLELARLLRKNPSKSSNFLFIAFSGEELGLYGSRHFTENPTIDLRSVNFMINMDMVGRLNDSTQVITIGGYGTSPAWSSLITPEYRTGRKGKPQLVVKIDSSGTGPSDHTSFYRKDIPVLFYFTGLHTDYHKPTDDADRINYKGEQTILRHILDLIERAEKQPRLTFTKTRETQTTTQARFSVSMGIMPDYTYSGAGVKVDGVSEGKPAQKAGIRAGDVLIQLGPYSVTSMESYMQTLSRFKKGDKATVKLRRGAESMEVTVEF
jgi:hypothetical protein